MTEAMQEGEEGANAPVADADDRRPFRRRLAVVTLAAFIIRVLYLLWSHGGDHDVVGEGDAFFYNVVADNFGSGGGFRNPFTGAWAAEHPPLTVLILGPVVAIGGTSVMLKRWTMVLLGTLVVTLIGLLGRAVGRRSGLRWNPRHADALGLVAAVLAAVNPNLVMNDAVIMSETPASIGYVSVFLAAYLLVDRHPEATGLRRYLPDVLLGAAIAVTTLGRSEALALLGLLVLPLAIRVGRTGDRRRALLGMVATGLTAVLIIAPWTILSNLELEGTVTLSTNDGMTLWGANCPDTYAGEGIGFWSVTCVYAVTDYRLDAALESERMRRMGVEYARDNMHRWPKVVVARNGRTWGFFRPGQQAYSGQGEGRPPAASWAGYVALWLLLPATAYGAWVLRRRPVWPLLTPFVLVVTISTLFYGIPRFRLPFDLVACVLAAAGLVALWARRRSDERND